MTLIEVLLVVALVPSIAAVAFGCVIAWRRGDFR